jgi:hypothetical protein
VLKRPGDWIELAGSSITFCLGAPPGTWTREEIDGHEMANTQVFLRLLPQTIGFTVS